MSSLQVKSLLAGALSIMAFAIAMPSAHADWDDYRHYYRGAYRGWNYHPYWNNGWNNGWRGNNGWGWNNGWNRPYYNNYYRHWHW